MVEAGGAFSFAGKLSENRRGAYRAVSTGVTLGCGSKVSFSGSTLKPPSSDRLRFLRPLGLARRTTSRW